MNLQGPEALEIRRRRLRYRAWHRGTREMDLVLGRFADAELEAMNDADLDQFECLMEVADPDLFAWLIGQTPVPAESDTLLFRRLAAFHRANSAAGRE